MFRKSVSSVVAAVVSITGERSQAYRLDFRTVLTFTKMASGPRPAGWTFGLSGFSDLV